MSQLCSVVVLCGQTCPCLSSVSVVTSSQTSDGLVQIKEAALELGYQPDETFCLKISQLREIFVVRWSVFLLGPAGCGKSAIWKTLMRAQQNFGEKTFFKPINPKVTYADHLRDRGCALMVGHSCCTASVLPVCRGRDRAYAVEYDEPVLLLLSIMTMMVQAMVLAAY